MCDPFCLRPRAVSAHPPFLPSDSRLYSCKLSLPRASLLLPGDPGSGRRSSLSTFARHHHPWEPQLLPKKSAPRSWFPSGFWQCFFLSGPTVWNDSNFLSCQSPGCLLSPRIPFMTSHTCMTTLPLLRILGWVVFSTWIPSDSKSV